MTQKLYRINFQSPYGDMLAISDSTHLYLLEFAARKNLLKELAKLQTTFKTEIVLGKTAVLESIQEELQKYFSGKLQKFKTPIKLLGSEFQKEVWQALQQIPYGQTCSYQELAQKMNRPKAVRALANATGANQLAIIVPCHRVIRANGDLGGYGGGIERKKKLLELEAY